MLEECVGYLNLTLDIDTLMFQFQSPGEQLALRPTVQGQSFCTRS